jgi:hypothetical protein
MTDQDPGGPKTYGSGTTTLVKTRMLSNIIVFLQRKIIQCEQQWEEIEK